MTYQLLKNTYGRVPYVINGQKRKRYKPSHKEVIEYEREVFKQRFEEAAAALKEKIDKHPPATGQIALASEQNNNKRVALAGRAKASSCEICGSGHRISFDHCHVTNKFRGWLCGKCNSALGMANDDPKILRSLADYLEKSRP